MNRVAVWGADPISALGVISLSLMFAFSGCGGQPAPTAVVESKVQCRSPNKPDAQPTPVEQWKFDTVQDAILTILGAEQGGIKSTVIPGRLPELISATDFERLGNLKWVVEKVRLEMEVRGEIERTTAPTGQFVLHLPGMVGIATEPTEPPTATTE